MNRLIIGPFVMLLLLAACDKDDTHVDNVTKEFSYGVNGSTGFTPIKTGTNKTEYGFSTLFFSHLGERYFVLSVPAGEEITTCYTTNVTKDDAVDNYYVGSLKGTEGIIVAVDGEATNVISGETGDHIISVSGTFSPLLQENMVLIGLDNETVEGDDPTAVAAHIEENYSTDYKNVAQDNSVYIIAYPRKTIYVAFGENVTASEESDILTYANQVFNQAICQIVKAPNGVTPHATLDVVSSGKDVTYYDEKGVEYDFLKSISFKSAEIKRSPSQGSFKRNATRAIAYILGVSETDTEVIIGNNPHEINLMEPSGGDDKVHLTFKQWNQLRNTLQ